LHNNLHPSAFAAHYTHFAVNDAPFVFNQWPNRQALLYIRLGLGYRICDLLFHIMRTGLVNRGGILLGFWAVCLQLLVFLQPLLPTQFQVAPLCEVVASALQPMQHASPEPHTQHHISSSDTSQTHPADHHDVLHQCLYCTVYANILLLPQLAIPTILLRTQVRWLWFKRHWDYVDALLQSLFLLPQSRAPPLFVAC
jgi:hypothetical protein